MNERQTGMSLLEILAAIAVGTILFIGLTDMIDISLEDARGQQAAHHQAQMADAARNFIAANYASLMNDTADGAIVPIDFADLQPEFLPAGFLNQNSYRQSTCVLVRQDSGNLHALVVGYGGLPIPDRSIASVAMNAGQGAGYINNVDSDMARGPSWSIETAPYQSGSCDGGISPLTGNASDAGHLVTNIFYGGPGQLSTDFLYRDPVPGRPDLNQMNTPLQMASAALVNAGEPCAYTALAIENTTKDVVVCDSGIWRYSSSSWKSPVASYAALLSTASPQDGDVRVTRDTGRAFVFNDSTSTWDALAIDQNGDLNVPGHIATNTLSATGNIDIAANLSVDGSAIVLGPLDAQDHVYVGLDLTTYGNIDARGNMDIDGYFRGLSEVRGTWMAARMLVMNHATAGDGDPCHWIEDGVVNRPHGALMRTNDYHLVMCNPDSVFRYASGVSPQ